MPLLKSAKPLRVFNCWKSKNFRTVECSCKNKVMWERYHVNTYKKRIGIQYDQRNSDRRPDQSDWYPLHKWRGTQRIFQIQDDPTTWRRHKVSSSLENSFQTLHSSNCPWSQIEVITTNLDNRRRKEGIESLPGRPPMHWPGRSMGI